MNCSAPVEAGPPNQRDLSQDIYGTVLMRIIAESHSRLASRETPNAHKTLLLVKVKHISESLSV